MGIHVIIMFYSLLGGCQHEIIAPVGEVTSPSWPNFYPSRKDCVWHFTTTPGHRIKLVSFILAVSIHKYIQIICRPATLIPVLFVC